MTTKKSYGLILFCNLCLSLLVVYASPRLDIFTLLGFLFVNLILYALLLWQEDQKEREIEGQIDGLFQLLHTTDPNSDSYEAADNAFSGLRDEIYKILSENQRVAAMAKDNQAALREYTENIAHQIKTPLTGSLLMLDLIEADPENKQEYVDRMRNSLQRLSGLSTALLKMASLDSGQVEMKRERVPAKALLEELKRDMKAYFPEQDIQIEGEDFLLLCDRQWTYEAIFNLMKNGLEASAEKGIVLKLQESKVYQSIIVTDFGPGLSPADLRKAYQRFYKKDSNSPGYGIGLPLAKSIMERQDGELLYSKGKTANYFELRFYK